MILAINCLNVKKLCCSFLVHALLQIHFETGIAILLLNPSDPYRPIIFELEPCRLARVD